MMSEKDKAPILAIEAASAPPRTRPSLYPAEFAVRMAGREKRPLGELFGLRNFGVNYTVLQPGAISALHHAHTVQDEFIYVLEGELTLHSGSSSLKLTAGMCAGFPAGGTAHHLENQGTAPAAYLEIGDRSAGDHVTYPNDDLIAVRTGDTWTFTHRDGTPY
jgi:uncharacterized cupin superfamily protein